MIFSSLELLAIALIFVWTGFVRTAIGFGGAVFGLPLLLLIKDSPVYWLPIIGVHLLIFTTISLRKSLKDVDWNYLVKSLFWIIPSTLIGIFGLISLPDKIIITLIYIIILFYAIIWIFDKKITSNKLWLDRFLLLIGGYIAGTSLTGAPFIVSVYINHVKRLQLRNTLFVLWFILVSMKMTTFVLLEVKIDWILILLLIPVVAIGHFLGLKLHKIIISNDQIFKKCIGISILLISLIGLFKVFL
jgi:hypothetical protein